MRNRKSRAADFRTQAAGIAGLGAPVVETRLNVRLNITVNIVSKTRLSTLSNRLSNTRLRAPGGKFFPYDFSTYLALVPPSMSALRHRCRRRLQRLFHLHGHIVERIARPFPGKMDAEKIVQQTA